MAEPSIVEEPIENPFSKLSACLIDRQYRKLGCDDWNRPKFHRLCGKLQRTELEMAALLRVSPAELRKRLDVGFTRQDGLILTVLEREIDSINSGRAPTEGIFAMVVLKPKET